MGDEFLGDFLGGFRLDIQNSLLDDEFLDDFLSGFRLDIQNGLLDDCCDGFLDYFVSCFLYAVTCMVSINNYL